MIGRNSAVPGMRYAVVNRIWPLLCLALAWYTCATDAAAQSVTTVQSGATAQLSPTTPGRGVRLSAAAGVGAFGEVHLLDARLTAPAYVASAGASYQFELPFALLLRAGVATRLVYRDAELNGAPWRSRTARLEFPVLLGYSPAPRWSTFLGASVRNDRELLDFDARHRRNVRWDLLARAGYRPWTTPWTLFVSASHGLAHLRRASHAIDPRTQLMLGAEFQLTGS